jgi:two-component system response regulator PilR (NtrC family)
MKPISILVVDDELSMRELLEIILTKEGYRVTTAKNGKEALRLCEKHTFDIILTDIRMPKIDGFAVLSRVKEISPESDVIMITAFGSIESAMESMKNGAHDYITKPFDVDEIKKTIKNVLKRKRPDIEEYTQKQTPYEPSFWFEDMVASDRNMKKIFDLIPKAASSKTNVMITGESGTGKELVARAIHKHSHRKNQPFVTINCGGIPENLLESELFGHKKGSFTGAIQDKMGLFRAAHDGTMFLDEIGDLPLPTQVKLLRVVQDRTFKPIGETEDVKVDVRIVSATNKDLEQKVISGQFREDLFYRLNVISLKIPPLRERKEDIPVLLDYFLDKFSKEHGKEKISISNYTIKALSNYSFPGNVRELENLVERSISLGMSNIILPESLTLSHFKDKQRTPEIKDQLNIPPEGIDLEKVIQEIEKNYILNALKMSNGKKGEASRLLNLSPRSFRYLIQKYKIL